MPSTFYAIPLFNKGESFLLRTTYNDFNKVVIVDCGYAADADIGQKSLSGYLTDQTPDIKLVDRLVITHHDTDHCGGAAQFIQQWHDAGKDINEVWLPAHWAVARNTPLKTGYERSQFTDESLEISEGIAKRLQELYLKRDEQPSERSKDSIIPKRMLEQILLEDCSEHNVFDDFIREPPSLQDDLRNQNFPDFGNLCRPDTEQHPFSRDYSFDSYYYDHPHSAIALDLTLEVLDTHEKMASTIASCIYHNVSIRWFDFKAFAEHPTNEPSGGDAGFLVPVNSREVIPTWKHFSYRQLFLALALTVANRESLAFFRPEESKEPAVLFTADSKLKLGHKNFPKPFGLPGERRLLSTAMHHASATNEVAYKVLKSWLAEKYPPLFVKNGGVGVKKPAASYISAGDQQCVRCVPDSNGISLIRLDALNGEWQLPAHPKPCRCQAK